MVGSYSTSSNSINCGCVIHGSLYDWIYVERLHSMLKRHLPNFGQLHVWTESERPVPDNMIKHVLEPMAVRRGWWYKMQIFNPLHYSGNLLYLDLDTVIVNSIDWINQCDPREFWCVKDFLYLDKFEGWHSINSSMMWFNTDQQQHVWQKFVAIGHRGYRGDQDFLQEYVGNRRYFDTESVLSWRWQASKKDWGDKASVLVFHGQPKPHAITDQEIVKLWC